MIDVMIVGKDDEEKGRRRQYERRRGRAGFKCTGRKGHSRYQQVNKEVLGA